MLLQEEWHSIAFMGLIKIMNLKMGMPKLINVSTMNSSILETLKNDTTVASNLKINAVLTKTLFTTALNSLETPTSVS